MPELYFQIIWQKIEILIVPEMFCDELNFISFLQQEKVSTRFTILLHPWASCSWFENPLISFGKIIFEVSCSFVHYKILFLPILFLIFTIFHLFRKKGKLSRTNITICKKLPFFVCFGKKEKSFGGIFLIFFSLKLVKEWVANIRLSFL